MAEQQLFRKTFTFTNQVSKGIEVFKSPTRIHVTIDSGPRFADYDIYLIIGGSATGTTATDGLTSQPAWKQIPNDGKPYDFKWSVPAGTYTLVLRLKQDHNRPNAKVETTVTVACDPSGKTFTVRAPVQGTTSNPYSPNPNPNPGNAPAYPGGGTGLGMPGVGIGPAGSTGAGTANGGPEGGVGSGHLGAEAPAGSDGLGDVQGPSAGPEEPEEPEEPDEPELPTDNTSPVDKAGTPLGPGPTDDGTGGPNPGPTDPGGPNPGPTDPGGGTGPAPVDPGPSPPEPDPPPPPPAFPPDWVMNVAGVLSAALAGEVSAIVAGVQARATPSSALGAGAALSRLFAGIPSALGSVGAGAAHVEAYVGQIHGRQSGRAHTAAPHYAFLYLPLGAPPQEIALRDPHTGVVGIVLVKPNEVLVYRTKLVTEPLGAAPPAMVHGGLFAQRHRTG